MFCLPSLLVVTTSQFLLKLAGNLLVARTHWHGNLSVTCRSKSLIMPYNNRLLCYIHGWLLHYNTSNFILILIDLLEDATVLFGVLILGTLWQLHSPFGRFGKQSNRCSFKVWWTRDCRLALLRPVKAVELQCIGRWRHASNVSLQRPNAHIGSSLWELVRKMLSCHHATPWDAQICQRQCAPQTAPVFDGQSWWRIFATTIGKKGLGEIPTTTS